MTATIFKMYAPSADEELLRWISLIKHETKVVIWTDWNGKEEKCTRWIKLLFSVQQDVLGIIWVESVKFTAGQKHDARRCNRWYVDKKLEHVCMCQFRKCRGNLIPIAVVKWDITCLEYTKWKDCTTQYSFERVLKLKLIFNFEQLSNRDCVYNYMHYYNNSWNNQPCPKC